MSNMPGALKKSDRDREPGKARGLRVVAPRERPRSIKSGRGYLLAFALVLLACLLFWRLGPWRPGEDAERRGKQDSSAQLLGPAKKAGPNSSFASAGRADDLGGLRPSGASGIGNTPDRPGVGPSAIPAQSQSTATQADETQVRVPISRSESRSMALTRLLGQLPEAYFTRQSRPEAAASAGKLDPPKWPESGPQEGAAKGPDAQSEKATAPAELLRFYEVPSQIRDFIPISISMLVYSKWPDHRWVNINGSRVHEGEQISSGPKVEEITPDRVVFSFQGHRFYKAVKED